ncbi:fibroblast growth factor 18-like isoform X2 [Brienomyrus brachyistius]|uniref:fibroblast growth factor 18-like isoform X2 n=1 Tax=Brienomyrus brachyistius TaxID=42636 RepID=UPI0020B21988|nr:fibroblast growth factor 18-like isoform X2 [Brienomyrus brachyistius]
MRYFVHAAAILCVQALFAVCTPLQVFDRDGVNFSVHVENQTRLHDAMSRRQHRVYQLYSRTSGKHLQVLGRRISARGEDGDRYAQLVVEADSFGSQVRIRGKETNYYLCMNRRGKLVGKKASNRSPDCVFVEKVLENNYTALMSARYAGWYVGFTKRGRPRRGPHTLPNQQDVHFMKRFPPGKQPDPQPFRFTTNTSAPGPGISQSIAGYKPTKTDLGPDY